MFSLSALTVSVSTSFTSLPSLDADSSDCSADSLSDSACSVDCSEAGLTAVSAVVASCCRVDWKRSLRAAKSVSLFISSSTPRLLSADRPTLTRPSLATRPAFFDAVLTPRLRSMSVASVSTSVAGASGLAEAVAAATASLHSVMGAPLCSRSCLTSAMLILGAAAVAAAALSQRRGRIVLESCSTLRLVRSVLCSRRAGVQRAAMAQQDMLVWSQPRRR